MLSLIVASIALLANARPQWHPEQCYVFGANSHHAVDVGLRSYVNPEAWAESLSIIRASLDYFCRNPDALDSLEAPRPADGNYPRPNEEAAFNDPLISSSTKKCMAGLRLVAVTATVGQCYGLPWPLMESFYDPSNAAKIYFEGNFAELLAIEQIDAPRQLLCRSLCLQAMRIYAAYLSHGPHSACDSLPDTDCYEPVF